MKDLDVSAFIDNPEKVVNLLRTLINEIEEKRKVKNVQDKESQLQEISKSINKLESLKVPVPEELRKIKMDLMSELSLRDSMTKKLSILQSGLKELNHSVNEFLGYSQKQVGTGISKPRSARGIKTGTLVFQELIIKVLRKRGGSATSKEVISDLEDLLRGKLTTRDMEHLKNGELVWENTAHWERNTMKNAGILKNNSPRGTWELSEAHR